MSRIITAATVVAGVIGSPVRHSLSPIIHNAWLKAAGVDGVYVALNPKPERLAALVDGLRGGVLRGLNITLPFKEQALALADRASDRARRAGAANLLVFDEEGNVSADNTDGEGLLGAFVAQAPGFDPKARPVVIIGAGGAARGAVAAFDEAGAPQIRLVNRTPDRAHAIGRVAGQRVSVSGFPGLAAALDGAGALINAT